MADNVSKIKDLKPPQPPGFNNRLNANWKLLLQRSYIMTASIGCCAAAVARD